MLPGCCQSRIPSPEKNPAAQRKRKQQEAQARGWKDWCEDAVSGGSKKAHRFTQADASWNKEAENPQNKANPAYLQALLDCVDEHRTRFDSA